MSSFFSHMYVFAVSPHISRSFYPHCIQFLVHALFYRLTESSQIFVLGITGLLFHATSRYGWDRHVWDSTTKDISRP
jgi:hypothetical protein